MNAGGSLTRAAPQGQGTNTVYGYYAVVVEVPGKDGQLSFHMARNYPPLVDGKIVESFCGNSTVEVFESVRKYARRARISQIANIQLGPR